MRSTSTFGPTEPWNNTFFQSRNSQDSRSFLNPAEERKDKIEGILESLGDIYHLRRTFQASKLGRQGQYSTDFSSQSKLDQTDLAHMRTANLLDQKSTGPSAY